MCRIRFGIAGIYFDELEPNCPRKEHYQPLAVVSTPIEIGIAFVPPLVDAKPKDEQLSVVTLSSGGGDCQSQRLGKSKTLGVRIGSSQSSPSLCSSSSGEESGDVTKPSTENYRIASKQYKPPGDIRPTNNPRKALVVSNSTEPSEVPSTKRVRFARDVQEKIISSKASSEASDASSSYSSDDSYIDPPSFIEPHDAYYGYCCNPSVPKSQYKAAQLRRTAGRSSLDDDIINRAFIDSDTYNETSTQRGSLSKGTFGNAAMPGGGARSGYRHLSDDRKSRTQAQTKDGGSHSCSCSSNNDFGSNVDYSGRRQTKSCTHRDDTVSQSRSINRSLPKLRSGKYPLKPVLTLKSKVLLPEKHSQRNSNFFAQEHRNERPQKRQT